MGDQIARAEKNKNVVGSSSSEYPEDIPQGCKRRLSWRNVEGKNMLRQVVDQGNQPYCWNISTSHMVSSHLYIHGKTETLLPLSARHLFVGVKGKNPDGSLKNFENLKDFLVNQGMIQEKDCACVVEKENKQIGSSSKSKPKNKKKSSKKENAKANPCFGKMKGKKVTKIRNLQIVRDVDERELIELLQRGPVTVSIEVADTFKLFKGDEVLRGYSQSESLEDHMIELTGYDTTPDGINYWEFQNSYGLGWGQNGFGKLIRKSSRKKHEPSLINAYMYPELLEREEAINAH